MERTYLTVTALNRYLKFKFDNDSELKNVLLKAEISNFKRHSRGHLYFTLKDQSSQISAVMFARETQSLKFNPTDGSKVIIEGYVSIYEPYGTYQVYVTRMVTDGVGDLYVAYEKLKSDLEQQGLFTDLHKKPIPLYPKAVGVITSPTGAAVRDVIHVIGHRYPLTKIIVYPALVQGTGATSSIVKQIEKANSDQLVDTLIVGRGGGSIEDLWSFNEESVARAVYNSKIPIISAVGHETDFTIADFVADKRAATPSQAAELAVPDKRALLSTVVDLTHKSTILFEQKISSLKKRTENSTKSIVFTDPSRMFQTKELKTDHFIERLIQQSPIQVLKKNDEHLVEFQRRMKYAFVNSIRAYESQFFRQVDKLELSNPLSMMKKGFSLISKDDQILTSVDQIKVGDLLTTKLKDGRFYSVVKDIEKGEI
ncbi:MAG: exodeoxyribonuclease VII large subunit [Firmicutes bacterium]|nr:exodeoxyribonuclease VII large subunit [Bacillota bacterium]